MILPHQGASSRDPILGPDLDNAKGPALVWEKGWGGGASETLNLQRGNCRRSMGASFEILLAGDMLIHVVPFQME